MRSHREPITPGCVGAVDETHHEDVWQHPGVLGAGQGVVGQGSFSAGLSTVVRALFDRKALAAALRLGKHEEVLLTQTVGYPS